MRTSSCAAWSTCCPGGLHDGSLAPLRSAEIIAVGSELLGSKRIDTNSLFLADELASLGIALRAKAVVGDRRSDLATCSARLWSGRISSS